MSRGSREQMFINAFLFHLSAWLVAFHWVGMHSITVAAVTSIFVVVAFSTILAALMSAAASRVRSEKTGKRIIVMAAVWFCFDLFLFRSPIGMPGMGVGFSAADPAFSVYWVRIAGISGLAVILLFVNVLISRASLGSHLLSSTAIVAALFILPHAGADISTSPASERTLRIGIAQPGWPAERWADVTDVTKPYRFMEEAESFVEPVGGLDLVVFPETSLPVGSEDVLREWAAELADSLGTKVLIGGILEEDSSSGPAHFNVSLSSDATEDIYRKRRLVPFAEKVPLAKWIPFFNRFSIPAGGITAYQSGSDISRFSIAGSTAGVLICFESLFFRDALRYRQEGAEFLVVQTQDGWWTSDRPRIQHFAFSRLLASAAGLPLVHSSVDGVSGAVDESGNVIAQSIPNSDAYLISNVPLRGRNTFYFRFGELSLLIIIAAIACVLLVQERLPQLIAKRKSSA